MERFEFLCRICKFTSKFSKQNFSRNSDDFNFEKNAYQLYGQEAIISVPNNKTLIICPSVNSVSLVDIEDHQELVAVEFNERKARVNRLLYDHAYRLINRVSIEIDNMLFGPSAVSETPSPTASVTHSNTICSSPLPNFHDVMKSSASVLSLQKVFLGKKVLKVQKINSAFFDNENECIILTGFRAAGAVCEILACMLKEIYGSILSIKCVTFGSPMVGDQQFIDILDKSVSRYYSIIIQNDLVFDLNFMNEYKRPVGNILIDPGGNFVMHGVAVSICCGKTKEYAINDYMSAIKNSINIDKNNRYIIGFIS